MKKKRGDVVLVVVVWFSVFCVITAGVCLRGGGCLRGGIDCMWCWTAGGRGGDLRGFLRGIDLVVL